MYISSSRPTSEACFSILFRLSSLACENGAARGRNIRLLALDAREPTALRGLRVEKVVPVPSKLQVPATCRKMEESGVLMVQQLGL